VGTAGAAVLGALGVAASRLWYLKTNRRQDVKVDVRSAAAAMRSARYLRIDGKAPKDPWDAFSGYYPVKEGRWVSIHCNFANHRDAAMKVLGNPSDRAAAEARLGRTGARRCHTRRKGLRRVGAPCGGVEAASARRGGGGPAAPGNNEDR